jgi:uncharacterized protein (TIGR03084 family)
MLQTLSDDVLAENRELYDLVASLSVDAWDRDTGFFGWTVRDQILHLHQVDKFGLAALDGEDAFAEVFRTVRAGQAAGIELSEQVRREFAGVPDHEVLEIWRATFEALVARFRHGDARARMAWFGPPMSIVSFASARQMEVWAHGQDIYDMLSLSRPVFPRIRNICELGVRTFAWSFRNRGLEVLPSPKVRLAAPDGGTWEWTGDDAGLVEGPALDFALVVTQRRAPQDTRLAAIGDGARAWLPIAQCFAGAPQEPAAPGSRPLMG